MDPEFWHRRWRDNTIAFHRAEVNASLRDFAPRLQATVGGQVLVPLCGKSVDMNWLAEQGHEVLGVELSPIAARAFFEESALAYRQREEGDFQLYEGDAIRILCGDVFRLTASHTAGVTAVYDRAALIALPRAQRQRYVAHLQRLLEPAVPGLLIALEYSEHEMQGPPFTVGRSEVDALYGGGWSVRQLRSHEILDREPHLRERGLSSLTEVVYLLAPRVSSHQAASAPT